MSLRRVARAISSPWVSISLLVIVFLHQAIGSAMYPIRQAFEVNEMEWFNGPGSLILWGALCTCLITASMVRVPWTLRKIGTHISHAGVVSMVITCTIYFGWKQEGDALLVRHYVKIEAEGGACRLLPNPGYSAPLGAGTATVQSIMPQWAILSQDGKSQQAWAILVDIELPDAPKFTATLIENRPDLTQYTLSGRRPDSFLPEYPRVLANDGKLVAVTADGKEVLATEVKKGALTSEAIAGGERSLEITNLTVDFPLLAEGFQGQNGTMIEWTLKTPAGQQSGSSIVGQPTLTRFKRARVKSSPDARLKAVALEAAPWTLAYHSDRPALWIRRDDSALARDPLVPMRSMDPQSVTALPIRDLPRYFEQGQYFVDHPQAIPPRNTYVDPDFLWRLSAWVFSPFTDPKPKALDLPLGTVNDVSFKVTAFAPYAQLTTRWKDVADAPQDLRMDLLITSGVDGKGFSRLIPPGSVASIEEQALTWVHRDDQESYDALLASLKARFPTGDPNKETTPEEAAETRLVLVTSKVLSPPDSDDKKVMVLVAQPNVGVREFLLAKGQVARFDLFGDQVAIRLNGLLTNPRQVTEPEVVPAETRQSRMQVRDSLALIQVTATSTQGVTSVWVPNTPYPHLPRTLNNDGSLGSYAARPVWIDVPGAGRFELCYGKEPLQMPGPVWMTGFDVPRQPGSNAPTEYYCHVGYGDQAAPQTAMIHMNHPLAWQNTFFFQASWDPQSQALTVLGVGNRPAGDAMLWAAILLALGIAISGAMAALPGRKS